jgi:hypothetical protein
VNQIFIPILITSAAISRAHWRALFAVDVLATVDLAGTENLAGENITALLDG